MIDTTMKNIMKMMEMNKPDTKQNNLYLNSNLMTLEGVNQSSYSTTAEIDMQIEAGIESANKGISYSRTMEAYRLMIPSIVFDLIEQDNDNNDEDLHWSAQDQIDNGINNIDNIDF